MKKILASLLIATMLFTGVTIAPKKAEAKVYIWTGITSYMNSIKFEWAKKKKATKYVIYRVASKSQDVQPKKSKFKKIKTIKNKRITKYKDKKVKYNRYYYYYVKVYNKKKLIVSSYTKDGCDVACKGYSAPDLHAGGYEDDFDKDKYSIYIHAYNNNRGVKLGKKIVFWRKDQNEKSFKKVTLKKEASLMRYVDSNVQKGHTYYYKAKSYTKRKHKKALYSMYSNTIKVFAQNFKGEFKVETISPKTGLYKTKSLKTVMKVSSSSVYNGKTILYSEKVDAKHGDYFVNTGGFPENQDNHNYYAYFKRYSYDNSNWKNIPKEGIVLTGRPVYLEVYITTRTDMGDYDDDNKNQTIYFGGYGCNYETSNIDVGGLVEYYGPVDSWTHGTLDLRYGLGTLYCQYDG